MVADGRGLLQTDDFSHMRSTRPKAGKDMLLHHAHHRLARLVSSRCERNTLALSYWPLNGSIVAAEL